MEELILEGRQPEILKIILKKTQKIQKGTTEEQTVMTHEIHRAFLFFLAKEKETKKTL